MSQFRKTEFTMDAIKGVFPGFTAGDDWNGWACPYFEYAEAERVLDASEVNGFRWAYDKSEDKFIVWNETEHPDKDEPETFQATEIEFNGSFIRVYPVGAYAWIWEERIA